MEDKISLILLLIFCSFSRVHAGSCFVVSIDLGNIETISLFGRSLLGALKYVSVISTPFAEARGS